MIGSGPRSVKPRADDRRRALAAVASALLVLIVAAGCTVPAPPGAAPLRYRDPVFSSIDTTPNLQYGSAPDASGNPVTLTLDLYQPAGDTVTQRPALVWVHGGGYCCGDKSSGPSTDLAQKFAHLGYVTVSIDYRLLSPNGCTAGSGTVTPTCYAAAIAAEHDAQAAVRWLRANAATYRIDPNRIGIGGDSAGAITASLVGLDPQDPGGSGNPGYSSAVQAFMSLSGGSPDGEYASAGDAPGLLFSGTADPIVPYAWSVQTAGDLLNDGVPAFLEPFQGAGHDPYAQFQSQIFTQSDYFFYSFLDVAHAQGSTAAAGRTFDGELAALTRRYPRYAKALAAARARERRPTHRPR